MSIKTSIGLSLIAAAGMLAYSIIQVVLSYPWLLLIPGVPVLGLACWFGYNWTMVIQERRRKITAEANAAELAARLINTSDGTWLVQGRAPNGSLEIAALHSNPLWEINGHREPATQAELFAWQHYNRRGGKASDIAQLTSGVVIESPSYQLDFLTALSDPLQAYAVIGPQRIGKSVLIQQLTGSFVQRGQRCVVIGTKAGPNEWTGCERYFGGPSDSIVPDALDRLYQESEQRIKQHINLPLVAIVLDDWLNTAELWPEIAERFFVEAATRMLTAGFVPYFILQSDSKSDWGIKHGAQLKNNFTHLFLSAPRHSGQIDHSQLKSFIIYPGDKQQHPVRLPYQHQEILQPTQQEQLVISLHESGASMNQIARQALGGAGGNQNKVIREILAKFGYVA